MNKRKETSAIFLRKTQRRKKTEERRATRPQLGGPTRPGIGAAWDPPISASGTSSVGAFYLGRGIPRKFTPYSSPNYLRPRRRRNSWIPPRGSDPAAPEPPEKGKSSPSSSPLLLGVGGGLYTITITKTSTISITISVTHLVPLIV